jgi:nucleoside-diphosphate-sugar epimerase
MIVGSGMMARAFAAWRGDRDVVVFASGVSNSLETDPAAFAREKALLTETRAKHPEALLLYFGTCSVDDPDRRETPYVLHKLEIELLLEQAGAPWMVLRLPLAIGPGHRGRALAQFLYDRVSRGEAFEVLQRATRYPIDVADVVRIARRFVADRAQWNRRINVALRAYPVIEFVRVMEAIVGKRARYHLVPKGRHYAVHCPELAAIARELNLESDEGYLERVLRKYFARPGAAP